MTTTTNNATATQDRSQFGSVGKLADGRSFVRFERHLAHSVEKVWAAITDPDQLAKWFPEIMLEARQGGEFRIQFGDGEGSTCDGPSVVSGRISRFEPPHVLECGSMRWQLEPDGGNCILTFTDTLRFEANRSNRDSTNSVLAGWHWYLDALEQALVGQSVDRTTPEINYATIEIPGRD